MDNHYNKVAQSYHTSPFHAHDSDLETWQFDNICTLANLNSSKKMRILDLGAGSCRLANLILKKFECIDMICVDNSAAMLKQAQKSHELTTVCSDALDFVYACQDNCFDKVLLKEMIHHIDSQALDNFIKQIARILQTNGNVIICTRPQEGIEYPFCSRALQQWNEIQPDYRIYLQMLEQANFKNVQLIQKQYPIIIHMDDWIAFIRTRLWSNFSISHFSEAQLNQSINEIRSKYQTDVNGYLTFTEKQIYITAIK